ncbi:MAG: hypothetical protein L3J14_07290 [Flavobacteriaceae bacterium]|nr:hypothetical protein [Flavobacteriaceae bacterium]
MKKILFYIVAIISVFLLINIGKILMTDFNRLTEYGFGYLTGKITLLIAFLIIMYLTRKSIIVRKIK